MHSQCVPLIVTGLPQLGQRFLGTVLFTALFLLVLVVFFPIIFSIFIVPEVIIIVIVEIIRMGVVFGTIGIG